MNAYCARFSSADRLALNSAFAMALLVAITITPLRHAEGDLSIGREQSERHLRRALELQRQGQLDQAEGSYKQAIAAYPKHTEAVRRYAVLLLKRGRFQATAEVLTQGLEQSPGDPQLEAYLAVQYCWVGQAEKALKTFERVAEHVAEPLALSFLVAECLHYNGEYALLVRTLRKAVGSTDATSNKLTAQLRERYAQGLLATGDLGEAKHQIELLRRWHPDPNGIEALSAELDLRHGACQAALDRFKRLSTGSPVHLLGVAEAQSCLKQSQAARRSVEDYLGRYDHTTDLSSQRGGKRSTSLPVLRSLRRAAFLHAQILVALHEDRASLSALDRAQRLGADREEIAIARAEIYLRLGHYAVCLKQLEPLLARKTPGAPVLRLAARASLRAGDKERAQALATRLIGLSEPDSGDYQLAAITHKALGQYKQAIELFDLALRRTPSSKTTQREFGHTLLLAARRDALESRIADAERMLRRAAEIALYRKSGTPQLNLALLALQRGHHAEALPYAEDAWQRTHSLRAAWARGRALIGLGRYSDAVRQYELYERLRTQSGQPVDPAIRLEQAVALANASNFVAAIDLLEHAEKVLSPADEPIRRQNLSRIRFMQLQLTARKQRWSDVGSLARQLAEDSVLPIEERRAVMARVFFEVLGGPAAHGITSTLLNRESPDDLALALKPPFRKVAAQLFAALEMLSQRDGSARRRGAEILAGLARRLPAPRRAQFEGWAATALQQLAYEVLISEPNGSRVAVALLERATRIFPAASPPELRHNLALAQSLQHETSPASIEGIERTTEALPLAFCNLGAYEHNRGRPREALALLMACRQRGASYPGLDSIIELKQSIFETGSTPTVR